MKRILIFSLLLLIGNAIGQNHYFNEIDHIPLMILKSTGTTTQPQLQDIDRILEIGADIFHCDGMSQEWFNYIANNTPAYFKVIPYGAAVLDNDNNFIAKYSEAMYSKWNVVDNGEKQTFSFANDYQKVDNMGDYIITKTGADIGAILYGPGEYYTDYSDSNKTKFFRGYAQQSKFLIAPTDFIRYNLKIELKLGNLILTPPLGTENTDAEICRLEVGYWNRLYDDNGNITSEEYIPHVSRVLKLADFIDSIGSWKWFDLGQYYTWTNTNTESLPMFLQKENTESRKYQLNMEFRLVWKAYPYRKLSARNLYLYDTERGQRFIEQDEDVDNIIKQTQNRYLLNGSELPIFPNDMAYNERVIGWNAVDEPGTGENFACMRKIDTLMKNASNGKIRLYFSNAGIFNGWVGKNVLAHTYQLNRTGDIPLPTLQNYIVEYPYQSIDPSYTEVKYVSSVHYCNWANIAHFKNNIEQFSDFDKDNNYTRPFGLMLQSGKWRSGGLLGIPTKAQFLYTANMGLLYGAKLLAVNDFFYDEVSAGAGKTALYNLTTQEYSLNAKTIRDTLSGRLKGLMGKTLRTLNQAHQILGVDVLTNNLNNINYRKLKYINCPATAATICTTDAGFFDSNEPWKNHFFIVNRHYSSESSLTIGLKDLYVYSNWTISNLTDTVSTPINKDSGNEATFNEDIPPGDGKLYSLSPTVISGGELMSDETIGTTTTLNGNLIVGTGVTLTLNSVYNLYGDITIKSGGAIKTTGEGVINVYQGKRIIAEGISEISGTSTGKITINFIAPVQNNGIYALQEAFLTVNYAKIMNAVYGIIYQNPSAQRLNGSLTITNCELINCNTGIKLENLTTFTPLIAGNIFTDCNIGIMGINNSGTTIMNNSITSWSGIWLTNTSGGSIINNQLEPQTVNNGVGIYLQSSLGTIRENYIDNFQTVFSWRIHPRCSERT